MSKLSAVIILSGGMDSTTLAYDLHSKGYSLYALSFNYGQKHKKELRYACITAHKLEIPHRIIDLGQLQSMLKSALTDVTQPVPHGHYADDNMKETVVPNRNMIMLSIALGYAASLGVTTVAYGAHSGDHAVYPDCRPEFVQAMQTTAALCHFEPIKLWAPYTAVDKGDIAVLGTLLNVPYEDSWTCYEGKDVPCGQCGACVERAEAFAFAGRSDPLLEVVNHDGWREVYSADTSNR